MNVEILTKNAAKKPFGGRALCGVAAEVHRVLPVGLNRSRFAAVRINKRGKRRTGLELMG